MGGVLRGSARFLHYKGMVDLNSGEWITVGKLDHSLVLTRSEAGFVLSYTYMGMRPLWPEPCTIEDLQALLAGADWRTANFRLIGKGDLVDVRISAMGGVQRAMVPAAEFRRAIEALG